MKFLQTIKDSIYNPHFFAGLQHNRVRESVGYYYKLIVILSVLSVIPFIPVINTLLSKNVFDALAHQYPPDLVVTVTDGSVTTNQKEPYTITYTQDNKSVNALVIDTKTPFSPNQFDEYSTSLIIKKNFIVLKDATSQIKMYPLTQIKNLIVNSNNVQQWLEALRGTLKTLIPIFIITVYIGYIIAYSLKLVYLFLAALLVMLITYLAKHPRSYMKSYQIAIHASTLPILVLVGLDLLRVRAPFFTFTILLVIMVIINVVNMRHTSSESTNS